MPDLPDAGGSTWEILSEEAGGWQPWNPGVQFYGIPGEELQFSLGQFIYYVVFETGSSGTQVNLLTGKRRPLRRRGLDADLQQDEATRRLLRPELDLPSPPRAVDQRFEPPPHRGEPPLPHRSEHQPPGGFGPGLGLGRAEQPTPSRAEQQAAAGFGPGRPEHSLPQRSSPRRGPGAQDEFFEGVGAYDVASEAYRESQRLGGSGRSADPPEGPIVPGRDAASPAPSSPGLRAAAEPEMDDPFARLEDILGKVQALENRIPSVLEAMEWGDPPITPGQARDKFAQLEAELNKVQCNDIDSISLSGLPEELATEARAKRKTLTLKAERVQFSLDTIFALIRCITPPSTVDPTQYIAGQLAKLRELLGDLPGKQVYEVEHFVHAKEFLRKRDWGTLSDAAQSVIENIDRSCEAHMNEVRRR